MYITKFLRKDGKTEDYWWQSETDAVKHMNLFAGDDSDLYAEILVLDEDGNILGRLSFAAPEI